MACFSKFSEGAVLSKTGVLKSKLEEKKLEAFPRPVRQCHVCGSASHEAIALIKQKCLPNLLARPPRTSPVLPRLPGKTPVMSLFLELRAQGLTGSSPHYLQGLRCQVKPHGPGYCHYFHPLLGALGAVRTTTLGGNYSPCYTNECTT